MKAEKRFRELKIERKAIDEESRTVDLAFSSEEPYERSFGIEVLDHGEDSADLSRLHNGAPLLVNHDPNDQIGVVENALVKGIKLSAPFASKSAPSRVPATAWSANPPPWMSGWSDRGGLGAGLCPRAAWRKPRR